MAILVLPSSRVLTPLRFGTATSDRVEVPASSLHENLTESTVLMLVRPTALTSGRRLFQKEVGLTDWGCELSGTGGNIDFYHGFFSGYTQRLTSDTPLARLGQWTQLAFVIRAANEMSVYHGPLGSALRESTYGSQNNTASGNPLTGASAFIWSNRSTNNISFQGDFALGLIVARGLSLSEVNEFFATGILPRGTRFATVFGANGRGTVLDQSGNALHATLTGAFPRESVAVQWVQVERLYVPAAGGGGTPQELAATGTVDVEGTAALHVQKPLGATGTVEAEATASLQAAKPLAATGAVQPEGSAELAVEKPLSATGVVQVEGYAQLAGAVEMEAHGTVLVQGSAELQVAKPLGASGEVLAQGFAALLVQKLLATSGVVAVEGLAVLEVRKLLAASGTVLVVGSADLQAGEFIILEEITLNLLFSRSVSRDLSFARAIARTLEF